MESIVIDILNPKAKKALQELANQKLIAFPLKEDNFSMFLKSIRSKAQKEPTLKEITEEVEKVRKARYAK